jgi:hypothetical protein
MSDFVKYYFERMRELNVRLVLGYVLMFAVMSALIFWVVSKVAE